MYGADLQSQGNLGWSSELSGPLYLGQGEGGRPGQLTECSIQLTAGPPHVGRSVTNNTPLSCVRAGACVHA